MAATVRPITLGRYSDSVDAKDDEVTLLDNKKIYLGTGNDLEIYHDASDSYIVETGTGRLNIRTNGDSIKLQNTDGGTEAMGVFNSNGSVDLYHNGSKKLETASGGATITGDLTINDGTPKVSLIDTNDNDSEGAIQHTSGNLYLKADDNQVEGSSSIRFQVDNAEKARILTGGGITFNGDTAAANALDDYEEGQYTATLTCLTSGTVTVNSSYDQLEYTKIGRVVYVTGRIRVSAISSPSGAQLRLNLPFTSGSGTEDSGRVNGYIYIQNGDKDINEYTSMPTGGGNDYIQIGFADVTAPGIGDVCATINSNTHISVNFHYTT